MEIDTTADAAGNWSVSFDTAQIDWGDHQLFLEIIAPDGTDTGQILVSDLTIVDVTPPSSSAVRVPNVPWTNQPVLVTVTATDQPHGSQVKEIHLIADGCAEQIVAGASATHQFTNEGTHSLTFWAVDNAGNVEVTHTLGGIGIDLTAPATAAAITGVSGNNGWWKAGSPTVVTLTATDSLSGVAATYFTLNGGATQTYAGPITLADGLNTIQFWSADRAGNIEVAQTIVIKVDHVAPSVSVTGVADGARYMLGRVPTPGMTATDATSGVATTTGVVTPPGTASGAGTYTFTATATDNAGNTTVVVVHYLVGYFLVELELEPGRSVSRGTRLTVDFELFDSSGARVTNAVVSLLVDGAPATPSGLFNTGSAFRYDREEGDYEYRLSTSALSTGVHLLTIVLDDGTRREVAIAVNVPAPPQLTPAAYWLRTGQSETVTGTGYAPGTVVTIRFNGVVVGTATATRPEPSPSRRRSPRPRHSGSARSPRTGSSPVGRGGSKRRR